MNNTMKLGDGIDTERLFGVISKRRYIFLKNLEKTLSDEERAAVTKYEEWNKSIKYKTPEKQRRPKRKKLEQMEMETMTRLFKESFKRNEGKEFTVRPENKKVIIKMCKYFARIPGDLDLNKGILLMGGTGTGKTSMMHAFHGIGKLLLEKYNDYFMWFTWSNCIEMADMYEDQSTDTTLFWQQYISGNRIFDDLGQERIASRYGLVNVMKEVLEKRYLNKNVKTIVTTNLNQPQLFEKYGKRVDSRINEMFNIVRLVGDDFRKTL